MKILVAEDDVVTLHLLELSLKRWSYEVVSTADGPQAWEILRQTDGPRLAILDWMMPGTDGLEICRKVRQFPDERYVYALLLTSKTQKADVL